MRRVFITCNSISSSTSIFELYSDFRKTTFIFFSDFVNVCAANVQLRPFLSFLFLFPCERSLLGISEEKRTCVLSLTSLFNFAQHSQIIMEKEEASVLQLRQTFYIVLLRVLLFRGRSIPFFLFFHEKTRHFLTQ